MSRFSERLIEVQNEVAAARETALTKVAEAKAALLGRPPNISEGLSDFNQGYTIADLNAAKQGNGPLSQTMQFQSNGPTATNPNVFEQSRSQAISPNVFESTRIGDSPTVHAPDLSNVMEKTVSSPLRPTSPVVGFTRTGALVSGTLINHRCKPILPVKYHC